jgi:hypothetical protein
MSKTLSTLSIAVASLILAVIGYLYLGASTDSNKYEPIRGYFISSNLNSEFYVCDNTVSWSGPFTFSNDSTKERLIEQYVSLTKGKSVPVYFEVIGSLDYDRSSGNSLVTFPSVLSVDSVTLALLAENELCPYPAVMKDMGY